MAIEISLVWKCMILCGVGLLKEFQPSKPYIVDYYIDVQHIDKEQVTHDILPVSIYSRLISLFIFLLITDVVRYKPVIIVGMTSFVISWVMTIWFLTDTPYVQVRQALEGIGESTEIAYFTYMYANVQRSRYKQVTSYTHSALHIGKFLGGLTGQLCWSLPQIPIHVFHYLSLGASSGALLLSILLPGVKKAIYFYPRYSVPVVATPYGGELGGKGKGGAKMMRGSISLPSGAEAIVCDPRMPPSPKQERISNQDGVESSLKEQLKKTIQRYVIRPIRILWGDFKHAYTNRYVLRWSIWWVMALAIHLQVTIYVESLWKDIHLVEHYSHSFAYNGVVEAAYALLSALLAISIGNIQFVWSKWEEHLLGSVSVLQAALLVIMSQTSHLVVAYICYVGFQTAFHVVIMIAAAEVATGVNEDSEAFIFGINYLASLVIVSIITVILKGEVGLNLEIHDEFIIYGCCSLLLGIFFFIICVQKRHKTWVVNSK